MWHRFEIIAHIFNRIWVYLRGTSDPLSNGLVHCFYRGRFPTGEHIATTFSFNCGGVCVEVCEAGELPDEFRTKFYPPVSELELPPPQPDDADFEEYLGRLRTEPE